VDGVSWESVATTTRTTPSRQEGNTLLDTAMVFYNDIHQKYLFRQSAPVFIKNRDFYISCVFDVVVKMNPLKCGVTNLEW